MEENNHTPDIRDKIKEIHMKGIAWFVGIAWSLLILIVIIVAWHYMAPPAVHFLADWQLNALQGFLFSSAVVGFGSTYFRRHVDG